LEKRRDAELEAALSEIKDLRKDLIRLERALKRKQAAEGDHPDPVVFDVVHGAFEIHRLAASVFTTKKLLADMDEEVERFRIEEELRALGATLLKKPTGWHIVTKDGEMRRLADADDPRKALTSLKRLRAPKK
jgi:hypothetical protein